MTDARIHFNHPFPAGDFRGNRQLPSAWNGKEDGGEEREGEKGAIVGVDGRGLKSPGEEEEEGLFLLWREKE